MNALKGTIVEISSSQNMSIVTVNVDGDHFSAIVLEGRKNSPYAVNDSITVLFKETEVGIGKNLSGMISLRNRFAGIIERIDQGELLSKITIRYKRHTVESVISTHSVQRMSLKVLDEIEWLVKTNEVTLMKNPA